MSKHAPGPWVITHSPLNGYRVSDKTGWGVAVVLKDTNDDANARLIGAAPQMLEALEIALKYCAAHAERTKDKHATKELAMINETIKAAKGEV